MEYLEYSSLVNCVTFAEHLFGEIYLSEPDSVRIIMRKVFILVAVISISCGNQAPKEAESTKPPSHTSWSALLGKHVSSDGKVNYKGFLQDSVALNSYLNSLSKNPPNKSDWSKAEQLAYWINAYNAFTVKLIVDHYPVKSIRDLNPTLYVPLVNTVWHIKFFKIGGVDFNLDEIEHSILRKEFEEPRIHFAIVCASYSCPPLRNEAFRAEKIHEQLDDQARLFINDPKRNTITENALILSQIFNWFSGDFTKKSSLIEFLNQYSIIQISKNASIEYHDYDWSLNE